jgi:exonuclease V gamma subunit
MASRSERHGNEALHGSALLAERADTYRRLLAEALPFARVELAWMKQRQHVTDEPGMLRNIQAAFASTAMVRGQTIEETIARLWGALAEKRKAA